MSFHGKAAVIGLAMAIALGVLAFSSSSSASISTSTAAAKPSKTVVLLPPCLIVSVAVPSIDLDPGLLATGDAVSNVQSALSVSQDGVYGSKTAIAVAAVGPTVPTQICAPGYVIQAPPVLAAITTLSEQAADLTAQALAARAARVTPQVARQIQSRCNGDFACFKACTLPIESGGNYANTNNPNYRGAWQFSQRTWDGVAGGGGGRPDLVGVDPAAASPADQDAMASVLYAANGNGPWEGRC